MFSYVNISAENGYKFWLNYKKIKNERLLEEYRNYCKEIIVAEDNEIINSARNELVLGISCMLGFKPDLTNDTVSSGSILIGSYLNSPLIEKLLPNFETNLKSFDGYGIISLEVNDKLYTVITGKTDQAVLYGVFNFLKLLQTNQSIDKLFLIDEPVNKLRLVNHWDNPSGTIERGYAGRSIFHWDKLPTIEPRYIDYARMLASMGINGCVINNVNTVKHNLTGWKLLTPEYIQKMKSLAKIFRSYGVKLYISVNFFSPVIIGKLNSADPFDPSVIQWWKVKVNEIYSQIPDFGGFLVKADSEGEPGPMKYSRTHADGANMMAEALKPHGGLLIWRAFVYGHNDMDRAAQAYEVFKHDEGKFSENVIIQIKNGPIDFQVREPVSPLFGAMPLTNQMLELQITQEYTGHSTHLCYLVPQWKEILDFDTYLNGKGSTVNKIVSGQLFNNSHTGIAGVINVGSDSNWTGHFLAQANTFGFGRLSWNPYLTSEQITDEWVKMTFGSDKEVVDLVSNILLESWLTYENYTSPLGVGMLSNGSGDISHYYPAPEKRQKFHHADKFGVGYDRTEETGTGFVNQYSKTNSEMYNNIDTCPDELLLFFHHVPYTHKLKSGKTVIQHIYESHFDGAERVFEMKKEWISLSDKIDIEIHKHVLNKLEQQYEQACLWRDTINNFFFNLSGIPDDQGRLLKNNNF
ncbi:MAG: alpha-glucuronidase [Bacteroidetes bacterium]|nr:alpha-glucuronidase [Bacteroidota bacterium]